MISAPQERAGPGRFLADGVCAVSTDIVKRAKFVILAEDEQEREVGDCEGVVIAGFGEERGVADVQPGFGDYAAGLQGVKGWGGEPVGWEVEFFADCQWGRGWRIGLFRPGGFKGEKFSRSSAEAGWEVDRQERGY